MRKPNTESVSLLFGNPDIDPSFALTFLDSLYDGVYLVDTERRITYWNSGAQKISGYRAEEVVGRRCCDNFLAHVDGEGRGACNCHCPLTATIVDGTDQECQLYLRHKKGHRVPVSVRVVPIMDKNGQVVGAAEIFTDLRRASRNDRRVKELENLAYYDFLTSLPNRCYTDLKVRQAAQELAEIGRAYGLLMIDLDAFKGVNDVHGHATGDELLKTVAQTLARTVRTVDTVGRWGGEEFLIIVADSTPAAVYELGERCRKLIAHSEVRVGDLSVHVTASAGGTMLEGGESADNAIARADSLMYFSKKNGGNRTSVDFVHPGNPLGSNGHGRAPFNLIDPILD
jgi:diguanylate cyclase (GGDEF)-like protein/PAS domain S-box-containing protein